MAMQSADISNLLLLCWTLDSESCSSLHDGLSSNRNRLMFSINHLPSSSCYSTTTIRSIGNQQHQPQPSSQTHALLLGTGKILIGSYVQVVSIIKMSMQTTNIITRDSHVNAHSWHIYHGLKIFAIGSSEANKIPRLNFRPIVNLGIYFLVSG